MKKLQECTSMQEANPILEKLRAGPAVKKLVETALILSNSTDPQQRGHAYSFMTSALKELEDDDKLHEEEDNDKKNKLHEEEVSNNNTGSRTTGSEQSSENTEPFSGEGTDTTNGEKPMQDMDNTTNQFNETGMPGQMPGQMPGMMPQNGQMPGMMPGMAPDVAQEMGMGHQMPPMDTSQSIRQMQYTASKITEVAVRDAIRRYNETVVKPIIRDLQKQIQETGMSSKGLDLDTLRSNATAKFRETVNPEVIHSIQPITTKNRFNLETARSEILQMNRTLQTDSIYN